MITTIFYSKTTGEIYTIVVAENKYDYSRFGNFADDMSEILDIMYISHNSFFESTYHNYKVVNGELVLKDGVDDINVIKE